ncbi:MAG TPA: M1 family aminopeptidase [Aggregatilineales bacterium]|nr:hypothetical protein [Anaerolineales bacterium]HRE46554.1 M1 family aminopeptidase [Aggregatilineales bacterium]
MRVKLSKGDFTVRLCAVLFALLACNLSATEPPAASPSGESAFATPAPVITATRPALTTNTAAAAALVPTAPAALPAAPCIPLALGEPAALYEGDIRVNYAEKTAAAALRITYRNPTGRDLSNLVLNVDPNRSAGVFLLDNLTLASAVSTGKNAIVGYTLEGGRLTIRLDEPLRPDCLIALDVRFTLTVPKLEAARMRAFAYTARQMNMGYLLPEIAPFRKGQWLTPEAGRVGEYTYSEMAHFRLRVSVQNAPNVDVIAPGIAERTADGGWQFTLNGGRSFTLTVTDAMRTLSATTADGLAIDLYYFPRRKDDAPSEGAKHALQTAREAAERYTALFGAIPAPRLAIVEGDFFDGMEYSGIVYVGTQWFDLYRGQLDSWLTLITAHEVAHQWFYALVTNDQSLSPFLDEALALYCEALYLETKSAEDVAWWWTFRVKQYQPRGYVDASIYDFSDTRSYINAVYLRGAQMVQAIREGLGDTLFFAWLRRYLERGRGSILTPADLWQALGENAYRGIAPIRAEYLRDADPLRLDPQATPTAAAQK